MGPEAEIDWVAVCCVIAAVCAVVSACVCISIWRKARVTDFGPQIAAGDAAIKAHVERELSSIDTKLDDLGDSIARIEQKQETEAEHVLRPRDLGRMHEKINAIALEGAARGAKSDEQNKAITEQLKLLQRLVENHMFAAHRTNQRLDP